VSVQQNTRVTRTHLEAVHDAVWPSVERVRSSKSSVRVVSAEHANNRLGHIVHVENRWVSVVTRMKGEGEHVRRMVVEVVVVR
jgi:hypothetical protein